MRTSFSGGSVDREVGVARLDLGRRGVEQLGVEGDRLVEVVDVERELSAGHEASLPLWLISNYCYPDVATSFDICQHVWQDWWHAKDVARRGHVRAGVLFAGGGRPRR